MSHPISPTEIGTIAELVRQALIPSLNVERRGVIVTASGQVVNLENESLLPNPKRARAHINLTSCDSFITYLKHYRIPNATVIFGRASETGGSFKAIIDYHDQLQKEVVVNAGEPTSLIPVPDARANWGEHIVSLTLSTTPEWSRWLEKNEKMIPQTDFAEFIENNAADIIAPDAGELLDMVQFLEGTKTVAFKSARSLRTGATELVFTEEVSETAGRQTKTEKLPSYIQVRLRPFVGNAHVMIAARLRYRVGNDGKLCFQYVLDRPFKVIEAAFEAVCTDIQVKLGAPVLIGTGQVNEPRHIPGA